MRNDANIANKAMSRPLPADANAKSLPHPKDAFVIHPNGEWSSPKMSPTSIFFSPLPKVTEMAPLPQSLQQVRVRLGGRVRVRVGAPVVCAAG